MLAAGLVLLGIVLLVVGGHTLVTSAVSLARLLGLSERVIGLTVVATGMGTSELAASIVAAMRKQTDVAVANMIGSNIFNVLGILSITALIHPIRVSAAMAGPDLWWMLGTCCGSPHCPSGTRRRFRVPTVHPPLPSDGQSRTAVSSVRRCDHGGFPLAAPPGTGDDDDLGTPTEPPWAPALPLGRAAAAHRAGARKTPPRGGRV